MTVTWESLLLQSASELGMGGEPSPVVPSACFL